MPRSAAGKAKRLRQNDDNTDDDDNEEEEGEEEEEKEEETRIEDIVRTKFEGDAHRALFAMIGKKRNFFPDDGESESDEDEENDEKSDSGEDDEEDESESEESEELELDSDGEEDIDDVNKVLEWEPIPDEKQKRFDQMGPQDDVSDASSSDAESEEEEETKKMRSLNANEGDVENEDRENALTLHLKKCQNEDEETLRERREKRVTFTSIFNNKENRSGDKKNDESDNSNARWEMSENATTLPTAFKDEAYFAPKTKKKKKKKKNEKNKNSDDEKEEDKEEEEIHWHFLATFR
jgi:hypothetical protein